MNELPDTVRYSADVEPTPSGHFIATYRRHPEVRGHGNTPRDACHNLIERLSEALSSE